jgi:hypothetical protein
MKLPNFVYTWIGKFAGSKLKLKEDKDMEGSQKWWMSKGMWTGVVTGIIGIYMMIQPGAGWPEIPGWLISFLGGVGLYSRATATKEIK